MKFKDYPLSNEIKRGLSELGFQEPLEVQEKVIPLIFDNKDLIVQSQTGSGKTAAFAIPICEMIDMEIEAPQALILTPTRELAQQVKNDTKGIGRYKGIEPLAVFGKEPIQIQRRALKQNPRVICATPGRMLDLIERKNVKLKDIKYLVIDEADEMILMGFQDQMEAIIAKLPEDRVTLLFSATMPEKVQYIAKEYLKNPENIAIEAKSTTVDRINQIYYTVDGLKKVDFMKKMIKVESPRKTIIFCNTRTQVEKVFEIMRKNDQFVCCLHGGMEQEARTRVLASYKNGEYKVLITTDLTARGIHVDGITHVINYSVPFDHENYVHRIGRTGRIDQKGFAITMVMPSEEERFTALQEFLGYKIPWRGGQRKKKLVHKFSADEEATNRRRRFKSDTNRKDKTILQINAGKANSKFTSKDILYSFKSIPGVEIDDIGKIEVKDRFTTVDVYAGKEDLIMKAFKTSKIAGKTLRIKKVK